MDPILEDGGIVSSSSFRSTGTQRKSPFFSLPGSEQKFNELESDLRQDVDWQLLSVKSCRSTKDSLYDSFISESLLLP